MNEKGLERMLRRQKLAYLMLKEGMPLAEACRIVGVSRPTGYLWRQRALEDGIFGMRERSRCAQTIPHRTEPTVEEVILAGKREHPVWGARKLSTVLWEEDPPVCLRTVDRILQRNGLVKGREQKEAVGRFERARCNELWQIDFKGMGKQSKYVPLSVLDDHSRYCLAFVPLPNIGFKGVWKTLWELFGKYGLPDAILTDNGTAFGWGRTPAVSPLEAKLLLLGVQQVHSRPRHPQTLGKVERFHRTVQEELGSAFRQETLWQGYWVYERFVNYYNWERPHQALGMKAPGAVYERSVWRRPKELPANMVPEGAPWRKVDSSGKFMVQRRDYYAGTGLAGERVWLGEINHEIWVYFAGIPFARLEELKV